MKREFTSLIVPPKDKGGPAWWFAIQEDKVLVQQELSAPTIPRVVDFAELGLDVGRQHYLGRLDECHCYTVEVAEAATPTVSELEVVIMNEIGTRK